MAKLTLSVDETIVRRAKRYAASRGTSISQLVERYLSLLSRPGIEPGNAASPVLGRLRGVLKGSAVRPADYRRYLERKYR